MLVQYWHLKSTNLQPWAFVLINWLIALPEYALAVPANRLGHIDHGGPFSAPQLKVLQEGLALIMAGLAVALFGRHA